MTAVTVAADASLAVPVLAALSTVLEVRVKRSYGRSGQGERGGEGHREVEERRGRARGG